MTQQENFQPPQPHAQQPQHMYQAPQAKPEISDMFVGKGKLDLFLLGSTLMLLLGLLFLDLLNSGAADSSDALLFMGYLLFHVGIVGLIGLLVVAGIVREDIPEGTRTMMIRVSGLIAAAFIFGTILFWNLRMF
ncbi:MAG: hypothetical protein KAS16_08745 [Thermoplasmata archaeon]|nr:hypothetical protein [Thermoplasmata archaeon]